VKCDTFTYSDNIIDADVTLTVSGSGENGLTFNGGDCFRVAIPQVYALAASKYDDAATFYTPMPGVLDLQGPTPAAKISKDTNFLATITLDAGGFKFVLSTVKLPFSNHPFAVSVLHYAGCGTVATLQESCTGQSTQMRTPRDDSSIGPVTARITPKVPGDPDMIGSSDGNIIFEWAPGKYFPRYGGQLSITFPQWYGANTVPMLNKNTGCTAAAGLVILDVVPV
jgi:hypothetical protein